MFCAPRGLTRQEKLCAYVQMYGWSEVHISTHDVLFCPVIISISIFLCLYSLFLCVSLLMISFPPFFPFDCWCMLLCLFVCVSICETVSSEDSPVCQACLEKNYSSPLSGSAKAGRGHGKVVTFGGVTEIEQPIDTVTSNEGEETELLRRLLSKATVTMPTIGLGSRLSERERRYGLGQRQYTTLLVRIQSWLSVSCKNKALHFKVSLHSALRVSVLKHHCKFTENSVILEHLLWIEPLHNI